MTVATRDPAMLDARGLPRVVVTGMGVVSCLGHGRDVFLDALRERRSGLRAVPGFARLQMQCRIGGPVDEHALEPPPRKLLRFMPPPVVHAWHAANEAIAHAALDAAILRDPRCGLLIGGGAAMSEHEQALEDHRRRGIAKLSPFLVPRGMSSTLSAGLAHAYGIGGLSCTISAACTSASLAIGQAMESIRLGRHDVMLAGGSEELHDSTAMWFDAMRALSTAGGDDPQRAARPYDRRRDGFVLAAGAGMLVLESLVHARARGAPVLAELAGYGACTDATSMVGPGTTGIARAMRQALAGTPRPDYINTHACATPQGDVAEWQAIAAVFAERGETPPPMSSIKGLGGHAPGAAGALDAIASVLMMCAGFIAAGAPVDAPDPAFADAPLVVANREAKLDHVLSNNFGFGGSATSLLFARWPEAARASATLIPIRPAVTRGRHDAVRGSRASVDFTGR